MSDAMIVVAKSRGYYGEKSRAPGERFAIASAEQFSPRWMVTPDKMTAEDKATEAAYVSTNTRARERNITDAQLLAEVAQSSGLTAVLRTENMQLKTRIKELEEKNSALQGQLDELLAGRAPSEVREGAPRTPRQPREGLEADTAGPVDGDAGGEPEGDAEGAAQEQPTRRTRRLG